MMSMLAVWVKIPLKPGTRDTAIAALNEALGHAMEEDGTLQYIALADPNDPDVVYMWELYTGQEALAAHGGSDWFKSFSKGMAEYVGGKVEFSFLNPLLGKGL